MDEKNQFFDLIRSNVDKYGFHITTVSSSLEPRYAYTIGLTNLLNLELIFAGGISYLERDLSLIINTIVKELEKEKDKIHRRIEVGSLGTFSFSAVHPSWTKLMTLGVFDYYGTDHVNAFQIVPDASHFTLDIPDMNAAFQASEQPVWQWLVNEWNYNAPKNSTVITNINALSGEIITEVTRWEINEWQMFAGAGPDVQEEDMRVISLGTILGIDKTLLPALDLEIGKGLWRTSFDADWNNWG